ncbi:hypothetical protein Taro_056940 [Colocasia esculenta]|uniref:Uncharacterized protein n=1 Tax=Colocasia esculenta TaxID=4460 RepID=A0A843XY70_COLES|nr:hypothetical protein [Colocasia esculenta]
MLKSKHYKGKTFEDVVASVPLGVDPSDWGKIIIRVRPLRMLLHLFHLVLIHQIGGKCVKNGIQGRSKILPSVKTHQRELDCMEVFRMGRCKDLPDGTQRWVDDESSDRFAETLRTWYGRGEGSNSSGDYHTQVQQLQLQDQNKKMEELYVERSKDRQELEELCAERRRDRQELKNMRSQMSEMRAFMQQFAAQPSHMSCPAPELESKGSDESTDNYDDDD